MALTVIPKNWSQHPLTSEGAEGQKRKFWGQTDPELNLELWTCPQLFHHWHV